MYRQGDILLIKKDCEPEGTLSKGDILIVHSDGIKENNNIKAYPEVLHENSETIVKKMIQKFNKGNDDSICFSLKYKVN